MSWLTRRGATAALAVGLATAWGFGWRGCVLLLAFFVSSSLVSKTPRRNERQVAANGGVAALAALAGSWPAFAGALAAATADTWATEIGTRARAAPRLITTGAPVPAGTSGGITLLGTAGGVAGALLLAAVAVWLQSLPRAFGLVIVGAGVLGMFLDSWVGATLQGRFACPDCGLHTERRDMVCHRSVQLVRGFAWLDNDAVNLAATLGGAAVTAAGWSLCC